MIICTKEHIENNDKFLNIIKQEKEFINSIILNQKSLKSILLDYIQKLADSTDNIDSNYTEIILDFLDKFKNSLELFDINMEKLVSLLNSLDGITQNFNNNDMNVFSESIDTFNTSFFESNEIISKNTLQIENTLHSVLKYSNFIFVNANSSSTTDCANDSVNIEQQEKENVDPIPPVNNNILENTLIISETKGKVFLPYTLQSLDDTLKNNPQKYSSIEDVIEKEYTLAYDSFRNPTIARFRETYKLMKLREKASFFDCIDLALELSLNSLLNPAVISACKNQDELDIYLDYLDNNETEKFDIFEIMYEIAPKIVNKK